MIRLEMKKYNVKLTEKQQKYYHYHQVKLMNMNILQMKKYYLLIHRPPIHILFQKKTKEKELKAKEKNK